MSRRRSRSKLPISNKAGAPAPASYFSLTRLPWHNFCFLLPVVIAYEAASLHFLADPTGQVVQTVRAQRLFEEAFERFGVLGMHLPAITMLTVLLLWHLLSRDSWKVRFDVLAGMAAESAVWTFPLLMIAVILTPGVLAQADGGDVATWPLGARLTISVGAGLYEELLFRMVIIAAADFVLVDIFRLSRRTGAIGAVGVSATAFAIYHLMPGMGLNLSWFILYAAAGVYLGAVYLLRGFGVVVAAHALYDVLVLTILSPQQG